MPSFVALVLAVTAIASGAGCGGGEATSCAALERHLTALVAADRARAPAGVFVPALDRAFVGETLARCRQGTLPAAERSCLARARRAADVDRCVARIEGAR